MDDLLESYMGIRDSELGEYQSADSALSLQIVYIVLFKVLSKLLIKVNKSL